MITGPIKNDAVSGAFFDVVIVGSGPAAVAALDGLPDRDMSVAVITGAAPAAVRRSALHAKIQSESLRQREAPGVAELLPYSPAPSKDLFATAAVGGLANYWGQGCVRLGSGDPWPADVFSSHNDYLNACARIESLFEISGGEIIDSDTLGAAYIGYKPRLLVGSAENGAAGLKSMRRVFEASARTRQAEVFNTRVNRIAYEAKRPILHLDDGRRIESKCVLLAAGAIGDARLIARSWPEVAATYISDHAPWMVYTVGARLRTRADGVASRRHFNALTIAKTEGERNTTFASMYDMSKADLNLLLASTLGAALPILRGWPAPPGLQLLRPIQIWTAKTVDVIKIDARKGCALLHSKGVEAPTADPALQALIDALKKASLAISSAQPTPPGRGFHYHNLTVDSGAQGVLSVNDFLSQRTDGAVICVDGAASAAIGCQPPTLTMMAKARRLAELHSARFFPA